MYPLAGKEHLQLRKEQGDNGRGIRDGGRLDGQLRGEHERGHRTHDSSDRNLSSSVETYPLNQSQISIFTEEVLKLVREKGQITAWDLYNVATEIYKPGRTDFPALIPQNGAMAELLLSRLPAEVEMQDVVLVS